MKDHSTIAMRSADEDRMAELSKSLRDLREGEVRWTRLVGTFFNPTPVSKAPGVAGAPLPSCAANCNEFASVVCLAGNGAARHCGFTEA